MIEDDVKLMDHFFSEPFCSGTDWPKVWKNIKKFVEEAQNTVNNKDIKPLSSLEELIDRLPQKGDIFEL